MVITIRLSVLRTNSEIRLIQYYEFCFYNRDGECLQRGTDWVLIQSVPGGNVPDFGRMFLTLKYTDMTQNTYVYPKLNGYGDNGERSLKV